MNTRSSSPLRHLDISDDKVAADMVAEKARELSSTYERIEDLQGAIKELLVLIRLVADAGDFSPAAREALRINPSVIDAEELLR
jgi:anti-sigma regulatory factor (Ser/Thr protein kinase)